jgi:hypothetical protein
MITVVFPGPPLEPGPPNPGLPPNFGGGGGGGRRIGGKRFERNTEISAAAKLNRRQTNKENRKIFIIKIHFEIIG